MNEEIKRQLAERGLRLASENEPGYFWTWYDENDEKQVSWVTDLEQTR